MPYNLIIALGVQVLQGGMRSLQCTFAFVGFSVIAATASDTQLNGHPVLYIVLENYGNGSSCAGNKAHVTSKKLTFK